MMRGRGNELTCQRQRHADQITKNYFPDVMIKDEGPYSILISTDDGKHWSFLAYPQDWEVWPFSAALSHTAAYLHRAVPTMEDATHVATRDDALRAGTEMGNLMVAFLRTDVPFMMFYDLGGKFAVWEGYAGENVLAYVKGFASVFADYNAANRRNLPQPKEEFGS